MKKVARTFAIACVFFVLALIAGIYFYTHKPVNRIVPGDINSNSVHFFALGDQGSGSVSQWQVARSMENLAEKNKGLDFVTFLGDNFYGKGITSTTDDKWQSRFEEVYQGEYLDKVPFYAVLGNHDHMSDPAAQIEYSEKHVGSNRWRMPNWYYREDFGSVDGRPLLRVVFIDTCLEHNGLLKEADFIREQFANAQPAPVWKIVVGHYPVRNYGKHGETAEMLAIIKPALQAAQVDLYLSGHDHDQQVIADDGEPVYFVSGGGGAELYPVTQGAADLLFSRSAHGFMALSMDKSSLEVSHYDMEGNPEVQYRIDRSCKSGARACLQLLQH